MASDGQQAPQCRHLPRQLHALREEAGLTRRDLAGRLGKPQSRVYNCESVNRRGDATEFILWARAYDADPRAAFDRLLGTV